MRILELLIAKDNETVKNIGDPAEFMGVYDIDEEESITAKAIEHGQTPEEFETTIKHRETDPLSILFGEEEPPKGQEAETARLSMPSLFNDDYSYFETGINYLRNNQRIQVDLYPDEQRIDITPNEELKARFRFLPREIWPDEGLFVLSADKQAIQKEIKRSRKEDKAWPRIHYLWSLNPVVEWMNDKLLAAFGRHEAPVLELPGVLSSNEVIFIMSGLIPNRKSHPLIHRWFGVCFTNGYFAEFDSYKNLIQKTELGQKEYPNPQKDTDFDRIKNLMPDAVEKARERMSLRRKEFESEINEKLNDHLKALEKLRSKQHQHLEIQFENSRQHEKIIQARKEKARRKIDTLFDDYMNWIEDTMKTEDNPYIQIIAVLKGLN